MQPGTISCHQGNGPTKRKKLGYTKSRSGCVRCKMRRVKCDEKRPCSACVKHSIHCSLLDQTRKKPPLLSPSSEQSDADESNAVVNVSQPPSLPLEISSHPGLSTKVGPGWISDLELMHHFTDSTVWSVPVVQQTRLLARKDIPHLAFSFPFLMHQVLAISALHLAHLRPAQGPKYSIQAAWHHDQSIDQIRTESTKTRQPETTRRALFFACGMLMAGTSSFRCKNYDLVSNLPLDDLLSIFSLMRGMILLGASILPDEERCEDDDKKNQVEPYMTGDMIQAETPVEAGHVSGMDIGTLIPRLASIQRQFSAAEDVEPDTRMILQTELNSLVRFVFEIVRPGNQPLTPGTELQMGFAWPFKMSKAYIELLQAHDPWAMVLLLHYCVLLRRAENVCWFLEGWATKVSAFVFSMLPCREPWMEMASWAMKMAQAG